MIKFLLLAAFAGSVIAQDSTIDAGLNFASWSSHISQFPQETYCPQTAPNPSESEYESCRSTAFDVVYSCPNGRDDSSARTKCICESIVMMSSCLTAYCPSNTVQASIISQDQDDYTSIYRCPSRLGANAGGGGGGSGPTETASPSKNAGAGGVGVGMGGGDWVVWMGMVGGLVVGGLAVVL